MATWLDSFSYSRQISHENGDDKSIDLEIGGWILLSLFVDENNVIEM